MCFLSQYASNMHVNKQLVNSENWSLNYNVTMLLSSHMENSMK